MRRETWSGMLAATVLAATVGVVAQSSSTSQNSPQPTPQPPTTAQAPAPSPQSSEAGRITVAGCLQAAPSRPTGTSGTAAPAPSAATDAAANAASGDAKFILANAVPSSTETTAGAANSSAPRTYQLIANEAALNPLVGKQLELTGTVEDQDSSAKSANSESNAASAANAPKLRVLSGKVKAEACTQQ